MDEIPHSESRKESTPYIGVDFDGCLAKALDQYREGDVGAPVWAMVNRVKQWIKAGKKVKILTARADNPQDVASISYFLHKVGLPELEITNVKDHNLIALWDDRAVAVQKNTGVPLSPEIYSATLRAFCAEYPVALSEGDKNASVAVVFAEDKVLLCSRDDEKKLMLPAGHLNSGETPTECVSRELEEETGIEVAPDQFTFVGISTREEENNAVFAVELPEKIKPKADDDIDDAFWHDAWDLPDLKFKAISNVLKARQVLSTPPEDRGLLVVFEGVDGSGKTSNISLLAKFLSDRGIPFTVTKWNSSAAISDATSDLKRDKKLSPSLFFLLHAADMISRYENEVVPALARNEIVICDRWIQTGLVRDAIRGIDVDYNRKIYDGVREPDVFFYLDLDPSVAVSRLSDDRLGFYSSGMDVGKFGTDKQQSALAYEEAMRKLYLSVIPGSANRLNADRPLDEIAKDIQAILLPVIGEKFQIDPDIVPSLASK